MAGSLAPAAAAAAAGHCDSGAEGQHRARGKVHGARCREPPPTRAQGAAAARPAPPARGYLQRHKKNQVWLFKKQVPCPECVLPQIMLVAGAGLLRGASPAVRACAA